jgi:hypothetical protein
VPPPQPWLNQSHVALRPLLQEKTGHLPLDLLRDPFLPH